ncbi:MULTISPECIES: efflux RND transporter periplasmic adaptor subunit [Bordetella]|uniref:MexH family multidrug efflux RND transporter periplasmic adaptor subunit n=1 Tax=Bordetella genomosp. 6 TaxID=463024 RepID=A0ABX4FEX1_9BORD|nr:MULTISPECIES: efflux RND transporter periplasmic adaptor subunit [Bordetella]ARP75272.1 MexH family multidrug efflux RND transporter periplasmic adaptor subunit [Bordetella genomosp. 6]AZW45738.1 MexH family multidrug efflux RND transporter periplasmic adaptor subunit [Bordetella bronchiseptica]KCV63257.1 efflux transporter, RND family, MFP subunit [Bordetella bronchiseptica 99-R-0433]OZI80755.1 MexH family multidrug efflux RND transporter periplasmic adaptor subunit [Bordetella genomosp. 6]
MKKAALIAAVAAGLAAGAALGLYVPRWLSNSGAPVTPLAQPGVAPAAVRVETAKVVETPFARGIAAVGSLRSDESVVLRPEVAGRIQHIDFKEGEAVRAGQTLVRLDDSVPRAELDQARANLALAQSQFRRAQDLQGRGFVSQQARDEAASSLKVQQAAAALAQARLDKMTIRAPFAGIVGLRDVSVGDYVNQGQDLAPLEAIDPLKVDFRVPEMYFSKVRVGQALSVRLDALPGEQRQGVVYAVSPLVDAGGRSILLRATVANPDSVLRPGMFARVQLLFGQEKALAVPEAALSPSGQTQYVFRVRDGVAQRVEVTVGERREGRVELLTGVGAGDEVVVAGLQRLTDGAPVTVIASGS